jgi:hypothetical protein
MLALRLMQCGERALQRQKWSWRALKPAGSRPQQRGKAGARLVVDW